MRKTRIIDVTKRGSYMEQRKAYLDAVNAAREAKKVANQDEEVNANDGKDE